MKWETYKKNFIKEAERQNKTSDYIERCLGYAKTLFDKNMPIIYDQNHLCLLLGFSPEYIYRMSNSPKHFYRSFKIEKKNGKLRSIDEPLPDLKKIQKWILREILDNIAVSPYAKAYVSGQSIKENARFHRGQNCVLTVDIKDFFPSITIFRIIKVFENIGYSRPVSVFLANLCCLKKSLPQGAPTSPALSNIVAGNLDIKLSSFARENKLRYTRYADDITFSGEFIPKQTISHIRSILKSEGFENKQ